MATPPALVSRFVFCKAEALHAGAVPLLPLRAHSYAAMGPDKDVKTDMVTVLESSTGTTRKRTGGHNTAVPATAVAVDGPSDSSRSVSPADSADKHMSDEEMDAIIKQLPYWVDQLGGIRNLVLGRRASLLQLCHCGGRVEQCGMVFLVGGVVRTKKNTGRAAMAPACCILRPRGLWNLSASPC